MTAEVRRSSRRGAVVAAADVQIHRVCRRLCVRLATGPKELIGLAAGAEIIQKFTVNSRTRPVVGVNSHHSICGLSNPEERSALCGSPFQPL